MQLDRSKPDQTIYLRRFLKSLDALDHTYCLTFNAVQRFYLWAQNQPPESVLNFFYPNSNMTWHAALTIDQAQRTAPVVVGSLEVNTVLTLAMWLEYYLRDICRVLYKHTQDGLWLQEPKLHRVDWRVAEVVTDVRFEDVVAHETIDRIFTIRDFAFKYSDDAADPGVSQDEVARMIEDAKRFAIDFEAAFFCVHSNLNPLTLGTDFDKRKK